MAARVARLLDLPAYELDALHHGSGWQPMPTFIDAVHEFAQQPRWVTEWQYTGKLGELLPSRADTVLWLDHPRWLVMWQVITRTLRRRLRREVLWNGNVEPPLHTMLTDRDHIIRWAWRTHATPAARVRKLLDGEGGPMVNVVRLRGRRQVETWLERQISPERHILSERSRR